MEYAVVQVMLNNPKRVEAEKARIAKAEQADGKGGNAAKKNTVNGTGTPVHISTLQVRMKPAGEIISLILSAVTGEVLFRGVQVW